MGLADANFSLSAVRGARAQRQEDRELAEHKEDRALTLERNSKTDEFTDETRAQTREQWDRQDKQGVLQDEQQQLKHEEAKRRAADEGALEFLYELEDGGDLQSAVARHNSRGRSRMVENTVNYDPNAKVVQFDMDSDGDGKVEHFQYNVPQTIQRLERITGAAKDRYKPLADGAQMFDTREKKVVATNQKDSPAGSAGTRPIKQGRYDTILSPDGKTVIRSAMRGSSTGADDPGVTKFNPQTYSSEVTDSLGKILGGKFDPSTQQWDFGGATDKYTQLSRIAQREAMRIGVPSRGKITAQMISTIVAQMSQGFDEKAIRDKVKVELEKPKEGKTVAADYENAMFGLGKIKPSVLKDHQDAAVQDELFEIGNRVRTALDAEYMRLGDPYNPATDQELAGEDPAAVDGGDEEDPVDEEPADDGPVDENGMAVAWPAEAPPQEMFRNLQSGKGIRDKKGNVWFMASDGMLHVQRAGASGQ